MNAVLRHARSRRATRSPSPPVGSRISVGPRTSAPEVGEIEVERRRRGQDDPRHPVGLTERDERAPEAIRQSTGHRGAIARQDEVDVVKRPPEQEIADRAAHQPHRAAGERAGRLE